MSSKKGRRLFYTCTESRLREGRRAWNGTELQIRGRTVYGYFCGSKNKDGPDLVPEPTQAVCWVHNKHTSKSDNKQLQSMLADSLTELAPKKCHNACSCPFAPLWPDHAPVLCLPCPPTSKSANTAPVFLMLSASEQRKKSMVLSHFVTT